VFNSKTATRFRLQNNHNIRIIIAKRAEGLQPPDSGKATIFFGQELNFSGRSQQPKMRENIYLYLLSENNGIHSVYSEIKCPKSAGIFTNN